MGNRKVDVLELYKDPRLINALNKWNLFAFLDEHNIDYTMDGKNIGVGFIGVRPCPNCGDTRNHYGINIDRKYGSCFICKCYYGPLKLISMYGHMSIKDAFEYLVYGTEDNRDVDDIVKEIIQGTIIDNTKDTLSKIDKIPEEYKTIRFIDLVKNKRLAEFFKKRHLHLWHVRRYGLKIYKSNILWTVSIKNHPVSYQRRNYIFKSYYTPTNLQNYIYGSDNIIPNKPLIIVEGFLDYTRIDSFIRSNYPNQISVTTGMLKSLSGKQIDRIINHKPSKVIVMFDNDSWFDYYRVKKLMPFNVDYVILPKGYDPNMLSWDQMDEIFKKEIMV